MAAVLLCWRLGADLLCKQLFHFCLCDAVVSIQHAQLHSQQTAQQQHREGWSLLNTVKPQGQSPRSAHIKLKVCSREALGVDVCPQTLQHMAVFWQEELPNVLRFLLHCSLLWAAGLLFHCDWCEMIGNKSFSRRFGAGQPNKRGRRKVCSCGLLDSCELSCCCVQECPCLILTRVFTLQVCDRQTTVPYSYFCYSHYSHYAIRETEEKRKKYRKEVAVCPRHNTHKPIREARDSAALAASSLSTPASKTDTHCHCLAASMVVDAGGDVVMTHRRIAHRCF